MIDLFLLGVFLDPDLGYRAQLGNEHLYAYTAYSEPDHRKVGQDLGQIETWEYGLGTRLKLTEKLSLTLEYGKAEVDVDPHPDIRNEVIRAELRHDHGQAPFNPQVYHYDLKDDYAIRLGAVWSFNDHVELHATYRYLKVKEELDMWEGNCGVFPVPQDCVGWWQNRNELDLSRVEIGISARF